MEIKEYREKLSSMGFHRVDKYLTIKDNRVETWRLWQTNIYATNANLNRISESCPVILENAISLAYYYDSVIAKEVIIDELLADKGYVDFAMKEINAKVDELVVRRFEFNSFTFILKESTYDSDSGNYYITVSKDGSRMELSTPVVQVSVRTTEDFDKYDFDEIEKVIFKN